jgi:hypothetical protein
MTVTSTDDECFGCGLSSGLAISLGQNIRQKIYLSLVRLVLTSSTEEEGGNHASDAFNLTRAL